MRELYASSFSEENERLIDLSMIKLIGCDLVIFCTQLTLVQAFLHYQVIYISTGNRGQRLQLRKYSISLVAIKCAINCILHILNRFTRKADDMERMQPELNLTAKAHHFIYCGKMQQ